jgi:hypothetical protein
MMTLRRIYFAFVCAFPFGAGVLAQTTAPLAAVPPALTMTGKPGTGVPLFNGKDMAGWVWHGQIAGSKMEELWTVKDGVLHCAPARTGATGYIETQKEFKNYVLRLEYRHLTNANGGVFICINGEEKVWPNAIQVQGKFGAVGDLINQNSGMKKMTTDPARTKTVNKDVVAARITPQPGTTAEKPMKEWNTLVITVENGKLSVTNNGVLLNTAADISPDAGKIGIQAEGAEMEFRKIELVPIE